MYYLSWALFIVILFLWRRDTRKVKESYRYILDEIRTERRELDILREKYINLLKKDKRFTDKSTSIKVT